MLSPLDYLEAAKADELAAQYESRGFLVQREVFLGTEKLDLLANKGDRSVAIEIVSGSRLKDQVERIQKLRRAAGEQGLSEFQLAVVNPPHSVSVSIAGLAEELRQHLAQNPPANILRFSSRTAVDRVLFVEPDIVEVTPGGLHVAGRAVVELILTYNEDEGREPDTDKIDFPLSFDAQLDRDLHIHKVNSLEVNTSSWDDYL